jgi:hypothetical protein
LLWWICFLDAQGAEVLEPPLARKVFAAAPLWSTGERGPLAYNAALYVRQQFRRQGFATVVYAREDDLYRRWGLREIQITAVQEGLVVWIKRRGFRPRFPALLAAEYRYWAERRGLPVAAPASSHDYPDEFLLTRQQLDVFKVLQ